MQFKRNVNEVSLKDTAPDHYVLLQESRTTLANAKSFLIPFGKKNKVEFSLSRKFTDQTIQRYHFVLALNLE